MPCGVLTGKENVMPYLSEEYDICVVGAGHAGCEAALDRKSVV